MVALTVPTWAPALALGFGDNTSWRASRPKAGCKTTSSQTTQTAIGSAVQYYCLYQTARLTYSATLISTPDAMPARCAARRGAWRTAARRPLAL